MRARSAFATACLMLVLSTGGAYAQNVVTIYSADGLHDGSPNWYQTQFDAFTKAAGIKVQYVEGGSGVVVDRIEKEKANPQADVLVTLPPFIMKAAADLILTPYNPGLGCVTGIEPRPAGPLCRAGEQLSLFHL